MPSKRVRAIFKRDHEADRGHPGSARHRSGVHRRKAWFDRPDGRFLYRRNFRLRNGHVHPRNGLNPGQHKGRRVRSDCLHQLHDHAVDFGPREAQVPLSTVPDGWLRPGHSERNGECNDTSTNQLHS
uniref:(northern house mosquito) hypothetical protein n=1 Tax=Culex pipiens TaxID=7175 RepID=A0A8D8DU16_CULPI